MHPPTTEPWNDEAHIAAPSEPISVSEFSGQLRKLASQSQATDAIKERWQELSPSRSEIAAECDVDDLGAVASQILSDSSRKTRLDEYREELVIQALESSPLAADKDSRNWLAKRKVAKAENTASTAEAHGSAEDTDDGREFDAISLASWRIDPNAGFFVRKPSSRGLNTLNSTKSLNIPVKEHRWDDVVIAISCYRNASNPANALDMTSEHVFLASHTLGDVISFARCSTSIIQLDAAEDVEDHEGAEMFILPTSETRVLVFLKGVDESASLKMLAKQFKNTVAGLQLNLSTIPAAATTLGSLDLQLNQPCTLIHHGNCEHVFVIKNIRARQRTDPPPSEFPIMIFAATLPHPTCRLCSKLPAALSVVGHSNLPESPCLLCHSCWDKFSATTSASDVIVLRLDSTSHAAE